MSTFTDWNGPQGQQAKALDLIALADAYQALVAKLNSHIEASASNNVHASKDYIDTVKEAIRQDIPSITGLLTKLEASQTYQDKNSALEQSDITDALEPYDTKTSVNNKIAQALIGNATQTWVENQLASYLRSNALDTHSVISQMKTRIQSLETWVNNRDNTPISITTSAITDFITAVNTAVANAPALTSALDTIDSKIDSAVQAERDRARGQEDSLDRRVTTLESSIESEPANRQAADQAIRGDIGNKANLETNNKNTIVSAINELNAKVQNQRITVDNEIDPESSNPVSNEAVAEGIKNAGVKVGTTMYWPSHDTENRIVRSSNPFTFTSKGIVRSISNIPNKTVQLKISNNVPIGWHAMDGKAELRATDYPELAEFMPMNVTTDEKIWLPYVACTIIKVKY